MSVKINGICPLEIFVVVGCVSVLAADNEPSVAAEHHTGTLEEHSHDLLSSYRVGSHCRCGSGGHPTGPAVARPYLLNSWL